MKYQIDHDYHIHSHLSPCAGHDPEQSTRNILKTARKFGFKQICVTDHYWDSDVKCKWECYSNLNYDWNAQDLPLPQAEDCRFLFGCETDMDRDYNLGIPRARFDDFDFIIVPINHMHFSFVCDPARKSVPYVAEQYVKCFEAFLDMDLPFGKFGLAHLTDRLTYHEVEDGHLAVLNSIPDETFAHLFAEAAQRGCGIELNVRLQDVTDPAYIEPTMRPYRIAKQQGCRFYLGSDAHTPGGFEPVPERFRRVVDLLELEEKDKFHIKGFELV